MSLVPVNPNAVSVVSMLEKAKVWLATAVDMTGPEEIAAAKAQIRTAETYAKELGLSKEIQQDAQEMVRRAEYALGKSIRKGQAEGTIRTRGQRAPQSAYVRDRFGAVEHVQAGADNAATCLPNVRDIAPDFYDNGSQLAHLADLQPDQLDAALSDARAEGNLSRANVLRKARAVEDNPVTAPSSAGVGTTRSPALRQKRADLIADLAAQGYSSRQMPAQVGVSEGTVRKIAGDHGIEIPADRSQNRTRRINSTDVVVNTATALEGLVMGIELIDYQAVDPAQASQWADSLTASIRTLNRFLKQIKETTHD